MVLESVKRSRSEHPGLTESSAEHLFEPSRAFDKSPPARERGADRGAEPLREAYAHAVDHRRILGFRDAGRDRGVPQPCAVEVER